MERKTPERIQTQTTAQNLNQAFPQPSLQNILNRTRQIQQWRQRTRFTSDQLRQQIQTHNETIENLTHQANDEMTEYERIRQQNEALHQSVQQEFEREEALEPLEPNLQPHIPQPIEHHAEFVNQGVNVTNLMQETRPQVTFWRYTYETYEFLLNTLQSSPALFIVGTLVVIGTCGFVYNRYGTRIPTINFPSLFTSSTQTSSRSVLQTPATVTMDVHIPQPPHSDISDWSSQPNSSQSNDPVPKKP